MSQQIIPLHSLVLCEATDITCQFPRHEVISLNDISRQLINMSRRRDFSSIVYAELRHRVALKLSLGERVVVNTDHLHADSKHQLTSIANNQGATVLSIDHSDDELQIVSFLPLHIEPYLQANWDGITVIGDIHGNLDGLERALAWARSRRHFVWFMGDVIDYGRHSLETASLTYRMVMQGAAAMMLANHEQKIARWLNQNGESVRLSDGNRATTAQWQKLTATARDQWAGQFRALLSHTTFTQEIGSFVFSHAAIHPSYWTETPDVDAIEQFALYGEADHSTGRYKRVHHWIDAIPDGRMVIVGHDILSKYPLLLRGENGGSVVFLDTGSGKGGQLSSADLRFTADGLHLECFTRH